jgi:hypothetical protein
MELLALSDLHLGDCDSLDGSVLSSNESCETFAKQLAEISGGTIRTLVICGDLWEACAPSPRTGPSAVFDLDATTVLASQRFFTALSKRVRISRLIIVPGNHDFALYRNLVRFFRLGSVYSPTCGYGLRTNGEWLRPSPLISLLGYSIPDIGVAYPNFLYSASGGWPVALFTHGHLFDEQVLTPSTDFLAALGFLAETGHVFDTIPEELDVDPGQWMKRLCALTSDRVAKIWQQNLNLVNVAVYKALNRRQIHIVCKHRPASGYVLIDSMGALGTAGNGTEGANSVDRLKWYLDGFMEDLSPVLMPADIRLPSYLIKGHTHGGGFGEVLSIDQTRFHAYDLGGWTRDAAGHSDNVPHTHVLGWEYFPSEPKAFAFTV